MNDRPKLALAPQPISLDVLTEKYAKGDDRTVDDVRKRIARALAQAESDQDRARWAACFYQAQVDGFIAGGRIASAAGTGLDATLINCFVQPIDDSIQSIFNALNQAAETMRRGGGVGYDFSRIRPAGALVHSTASRASGPVSYMQIFDRMCETVESAGARRGAQMGVLRCDHPDIELFVHAKDQGALRNFNLSVGCTDAFMQAVETKASWQLIHCARPGDELLARGTFERPDRQWVYREMPARALFDQIMRSTYDHAEPGVVFLDTVNRHNNLAWCENIAATNPCGEQPLPPYGCCDLGSINLTQFIEQPFTGRASFAYERFAALIPTAVRMLDNTLDVTSWPLPEQAQEAMAKRRIGLGFTGLGDALIMLGIRFDEESARKTAADIAACLRNNAYQASVELAKEKGPFPLFDAAHYGAPGSAASRLPESIRNDISRCGLRNSHLLSIAPTGTISLAFADNASNGIEPAFSWVYQRKKRTDDAFHVYEVQDHAWRRYRQCLGLPDSVILIEFDATLAQSHSPGVVFDHHGQATAMLPASFVSALQISAKDHALMSMAVQPFIDSAISKTVNVAQDYPYQDFQALYMQAWHGGLKGLTTYRPNAVLGAVLQPPSPDAPDQSGAGGTAVRDRAIPADLDLSSADRRIALNRLPSATLANLRWPGRPELAGGNPAWTYLVNHPLGEFAVFIGHVDGAANDTATGSYPFEVWINGAEQPRGLGALAKTLSMDMRANDSAWLDLKLRALEKASADDEFFLAMPPHGFPVRVPSLVAGFARLVRYRCNELGVFRDLPETSPLVSSLFGLREPKTGPDGTMSWTVDVINPATGDDMVLFVKELVMPDGQRRPYSIWLSGEYPRTFDGLCKALSIDMWVLDPAWIGMKLRKLLNYTEAAGTMRARVPGREQSRLWPSTIAYLAQLILHRYQMLGILDETGQPMAGTSTLPASEQDKRRLQDRNQPLPGTRCDECANRSVIRRDGCDFCTACGHIGMCG